MDRQQASRVNTLPPWEETNSIVQYAVWRFRDLGLGSGINVTNPQMWDDKTSGRLREVSPDLKNIDITEGRGEREYHQQVMPSFAVCQKEIASAMKDQALSLNVGTHLRFSDDANTNKIVVSQKIVNRTVSFRDNYFDVPHFTSSDSVFEMRLCSLIYKRLRPRQEDQGSKFQNSPVSVLGDHIATLQQDGNGHRLGEIARACKDYVTETGITHYVSAIELGAMQYNVYSMGQYQEVIGAAMGSMGGPLSPAPITGQQGKWMLDLFNFNHTVGKMGNGVVRKDTTAEAVLSYKVEPIYHLVKLRHVRVALRKAVRDFIQKNKAKDTARRYMVGSISSKSKVVYWTVNQHNQVMGTESKKQAALFHIIPAGNNQNPSEFYIRYDKHTTGYGTRHYYLRYAANLLGCTGGPLTLSSELGERFTVHGQIPVPNLCASMTNTLQDWTEGQDLYLNCSRHSMFKMNGYVGMRSKPIFASTSPLRSGIELDSDSEKTYETIGVSVFQKEDDKSVCTLFRLVLEDKSTKTTEEEDNEHEFDELFGQHMTFESSSNAPRGDSKKKLLVRRDLLTDKSSRDLPTFDLEPQEPRQRDRSRTLGSADRPHRRPKLREIESFPERSQTISGGNRTDRKIPPNQQSTPVLTRRRSRASSVGSANSIDFHRREAFPEQNGRRQRSKTVRVPAPAEQLFEQTESRPRSKTVSASTSTEFNKIIVRRSNPNPEPKHEELQDYPNRQASRRVSYSTVSFPNMGNNKKEHQGSNLQRTGRARECLLDYADVDLRESEPRRRVKTISVSNKDTVTRARAASIKRPRNPQNSS